jgi:hypothetical protein
MKYMLMHKDKPVLSMELDEGTGTIISLYEVFEPNHVPVGATNKDGAADRVELNNWWTGRAIPASRSGLREALDAMNIASPQMLLTKCYGLSLSDQYWVKPEGTDLRWKDINFFDNAFSEDVGNILFGQIPASGAFSLMSPDNTSDGWLRKKWKIIDGKRCLVKGGSEPAVQEPFNEAIATIIMRRIEVPHVDYSVIWDNKIPYSVCEDFITAETELVSAWHIFQTQKKRNNVSAYQHFLDCCHALEIPGARDSIDKMLAVDFIIANEDRHFNNFGAVRNADTLEWIGISPVFDSGTSLWYNKFTPQITPLAKAPSKPFRGIHDEQIKLARDFSWYSHSALDGIGEMFSDILSGSPFIDDARRSALCFGIEKRVSMLTQYIEDTQKNRADRERER